MLQVIEQTERERDIKLANRASVQLINIQTAKLDVKTEHLPHKQSLTHVLALAVNSEHALGAAALGLESVEAGIAADVEKRLTAQVVREKFLNCLPGTKRMIDRLAHHALSFGVEPAAEIDAVKPRLESLQLR